MLRFSISARHQRLGREFLWIGLGQGMAAIGALVGIRLLTNLPNPREYGELALGMTVAMLCQQVILDPLSAFLRFFASAQEIDRFRVYLRGVRILA